VVCEEFKPRKHVSTAIIHFTRFDIFCGLSVQKLI
jgi:hypothetical protein